MPQGGRDNGGCNVGSEVLPVKLQSRFCGDSELTPYLGLNYNVLVYNTDNPGVSGILKCAETGYNDDRLCDETEC